MCLRVLPIGYKTVELSMKHTRFIECSTSLALLVFYEMYESASFNGLFQRRLPYVEQELT